MATIVVCVHHRLTARQPSCGARGAAALLGALREQVQGRAEILPVHCLGACEQGPNACINGVLYQRLTVADAPRLASCALASTLTPKA